jgi:hypothetical protein
MVSMAAGLPATGQDLHPGIIGEDNRVRLDDREPRWDAIGHVNIGGFRTARRCTGPWWRRTSSLRRPTVS